VVRGNERMQRHFHLLGVRLARLVTVLLYCAAAPRGDVLELFWQVVHPGQSCTVFYFLLYLPLNDATIQVSTQ
jgi:hypothetical protein